MKHLFIENSMDDHHTVLNLNEDFGAKSYTVKPLITVIVTYMNAETIGPNLVLGGVPEST